MRCNGTGPCPAAEVQSQPQLVGSRQAVAGRQGTDSKVTRKGDTALGRTVPFPALPLSCCVPSRRSLALSVLRGLTCTMGRWPGLLRPGVWGGL